MSNNFLVNESILLASLSENKHPAVNTYQALEVLDLTQLKNVDSAGVAYLVQIKTQYPALLLVNASTKLRTLAGLYGVENLFEK